MAESNGSLSAANGSTHLNGVNGKLNGHQVGRRRVARRNKSFLAWTFSVFARLATWTAILTILFRCPSSLDACDETSPYICKPYFQVKDAVSPHVQPYYDQYAAPYVDIAKPYYDIVDSKVWQPTRAYAVQYGAPWVERGREQAIAQWTKNGQPQLAKIQDFVQSKYDQSVGPYVSQTSASVGPYYEIARTNALQVYYELLLPSYEFIHPYAAQGYDVTADFTTGTALPTAYWAWNKTYAFLDSAVWPHVRAIYLANVEPQLVRIGERLGRYKTRENAKPLRDSAPISSVVDSIYSSFSKPAPQSTTASSTFSEQPIATESLKPEVLSQDDTEERLNPVQAPPATENETDKRKAAREMVAHDLELWQNKFAQQADEGANDMEERVDDIAKRMISRNVNTTGKGLLQDLKSTIESEFKNLKSKISSLVQAGGDSNSDLEEKVVAVVRSSGKTIKKKAQAIREWRESYDKELQNTVLSIADVHFQILDETRSLALQQIGMRWAWTDGVTYKDWAKYHELKNTLSEWTEQLKNLVVTHPSLLEAQDASAQVEDEGMDVASAAARELARLKEVARWKVVAKDATDNFDSDEMKRAAEAVEAATIVVADKLEDAASTVSSEFTEATSAAAAAVEDATEEVKEFFSSIVEPIEHSTSSLADFAEEVSEAVEEQSTAASQSVSSILASGEEGLTSTEEVASAASSSVESVFSDASDLASEGTDVLSSVVDQISSTVESLSSDVSESTSSVAEELPDELSEAVSSATDIIDDAPEALVEEDVVEIEEDPMNEREETPMNEMPEVRPVWFGAAAQSVPSRQPILEDYDDTDYIASATDAAQAAYSSAVALASEQYSSAASVVSAQIYGTPKPVHDQLLSSMSVAYESAISAASTKLNEAVDAASSGIKPTSTATTPTIPNLVDWERVESIAAQRLNEGRLWAEIQYQSAMIALGLATPTPSSNMEKFYEQAKVNYYAGLGLAQDRYSSFLAGASSALSSLTATPTPTDFAGTASSIASVARASAASAANAAGDAAGSAYSAAGDSISSATDAAGSVISAAGDTIASAAQVVDDSVSSVVDAANEQISSAGEAIADTWASAIAGISAQIYGPDDRKRIGWYDNLFSDASSYASVATEAAESSAVTASAEASKQYAAVSELVSELISGKEPTFTESVLSRLQAAYSTASASVESLASEASKAAASVGDSVGSAASQATEKVKETVQQVRDEL